MGLPSSIAQTYLAIALQQRKIPLLSAVNSETQEGITQSILALNLSGSEPIQLVIDSGGGSLYHGLWISDAIRCSEAPVDGLVVGTAYSAAFWILQSCCHRVAYPHARFMFHGFRWEIHTRMDMLGFTREIRDLKRQQGEILDLVVHRTGQSLTKLRRWAREERLFSAPEALELGMIDEIVQTKPLLGRGE